MRTLIFLCLLIITIASSRGQGVHNGCFLDLNDLAFRSGHTAGDWKNFYNDPDTEGSQFLDDSWSRGVIILKNDTMVSDVDLRYNIFTRQMQIRTIKDTLLLSRPEKVRSLSFNQRTFFYESFIKDDLSAKDYFEVIVEGKCRMLLQREVTFVPKNPPTTPYSGGYENNRFILKEHIYMQRSGSPAFYIKSSKKAILSYLGDHQKELNLYIKNEKIKFSDKNSVAKLISYYNSLPDAS